MPHAKLRWVVAQTPVGASAATGGTEGPAPPAVSQAVPHKHGIDSDGPSEPEASAGVLHVITYLSVHGGLSRSASGSRVYAGSVTRQREQSVRDLIAPCGSRPGAFGLLVDAGCTNLVDAFHRAAIRCARS